MHYIGSKDRIIGDLLPIITKYHTENTVFYDVFAGGMNVCSRITGKVVANDFCTPLIDFWHNVLTGWQPPYVSEEEYHDIKDNKHAYPSFLVGWAAFGCSFRGKYFGGYCGTSLKKSGKYKDYQENEITKIGWHIKAMQNIVLVNENYDNLRFEPNSVIYCDPPYFETTGYMCSINHGQFWNWCRELVSKGHRVYVSEYNAPEDFKCIWEKTVTNRMSITNKGGRIFKSTERLFTHITQNE